jgi:hypothetical protein
VANDPSRSCAHVLRIILGANGTVPYHKVTCSGLELVASRAPDVERASHYFQSPRLRSRKAGTRRFLTAPYAISSFDAHLLFRASRRRIWYLNRQRRGLSSGNRHFTHTNPTPQSISSNGIGKVPRPGLPTARCTRAPKIKKRKEIGRCRRAAPRKHCTRPAIKSYHYVAGHVALPCRGKPTVQKAKGPASAPFSNAPKRCTPWSPYSYLNRKPAPAGTRVDEPATIASTVSTDTPQQIHMALPADVYRNEVCERRTKTCRVKCTSVAVLQCR